MDAPQDHCASYYAATCNDDTRYPTLLGQSRADVCIIGAGFSGIAAALALAERGFSVVVLEQHRVGWGASGRNGGQMIGGVTGHEHVSRFWGGRRDKELFEIGYLGHEIIARRVQQYAIDCDLKYGYMDVALRPRHLEQLRRGYEDLCRRGMADDLQWIPGGDMHHALATDRYLGGLVNTRNGHLHPLNLCLGEARAAASLGVSIHEGCEVTDIVHGARPVVKTQQGSVQSDFVIIAGNAYHQLERKRFSGRQFPAGTYILATEPLSEAEAAELSPRDLAVCDLNEVCDYFRLSPDRRMLFGGRCHYSGREPYDVKASMLPRMLQVFPQLRDKRIDYAWGGKIGISLNQVPQLGQIDSNVFYAQSYAGNGVSMTHAFGDILAEAICGTFERMDIFSRIPQRRIPLGQKMGGQLFALGMLYHRVRDLL